MTRLALIVVLLGMAAAALAASPTVDAILATPRSEASQSIEVALTLIDLQERAEAEQVAKELLELDLSSSQKAALVEQVGSARLARLAREFPDTRDFVESCFLAASNQATSNERLSELVEQLQSENRQTMTAALLAISRTGQAGIAYCLDAIDSTDDRRLQGRLREALVALEPLSIQTLCAAVADENPAVQTQAIYALGRLGELGQLRLPLAAALVAGPAVIEESTNPIGQAARWAYVQLSGETATPDRAIQRIDSVLDQLLKGESPFAANAEGMIAWQSDRGAPVQWVKPREVSLAFAARLAKARQRITPTNGPLAPITALLAAEVGSEGSLSELDNEQLNASLNEAMDRHLTRAAIACCRELGDRGDRAVLLTFDGQPAPLAVALQAGHPSVRFAAIKAILAIDPQEPFPGSSRVAEELGYFAAGSGEVHALVAYPTLAAAGQTAGLLISAGYAATPVNRGLDLVSLAAKSPNVRFVLLDLALLRTPVRESLFRLRRTPATATTPVALLASEGRLGEAEALAAEHGGAAGHVLAIPRPHTAEAIAKLAKRLEQLAPADTPGAEERVTQAEFAREAIARLSTSGPRFYGLNRRQSAPE